MSKKENNYFYAVYDLSVSPATFEILSFLVAAEIECHKSKKTGLFLVVVPSEEKNGQESAGSANFFGEDETRRRIESIIKPATNLLPDCEKVQICQDRDEARSLLASISEIEIFPENYDIENPVAAFTMAEVVARYLAGYALPTLKANKSEVEAVQKWSKENIPTGMKAISITLRETNYGDTKNSDISVWAEIAKQIKALGYFPIIVRDTAKVTENLDDRFGPMLTYSDAATDLGVRTAFYESCHLNLVGQNGPMGLCFLDHKVNCLAFLQVDEDWHDARSDAIRCSFGMEVGEQAHFLGPTQKMVWGADDVEFMMSEISSMFELLNDFESADTDVKYVANAESIDLFVERMINERQWGPARVVARYLLALYPENGSYNYQLGLAETWRRNPEQGLVYLQKAKKLGLETAANYVAIGEAMILMGRFEQAFANIQLGLEIAPDHFHGYLKAAIALEALGQIESAAEYLDVALQINPGNESARNLRVLMLRKV